LLQVPDRKGKVESGVGHAKKTPLKGHRFESLEEAQAYLDHWEERWADTRIHGTTKRQGIGPDRNLGGRVRSRTSFVFRARILRQPLSNPGDVFMGGRPVRVAGIAVEHQHAGFQRFFESFLAECNGLVVVVRTNNLDIHAVAHKPPADRAIPAALL
jgi:hypothetical protein